MKKLIFFIVGKIPFISIIAKTRSNQCPIKLSHIFWQKIVGINRAAYWPVHFTSIVTHPQNIYAGIDSCPGYSPGCYIQGNGSIYVGDYTQIAPNVGIISSNHDLYDNTKHILNKIVIGKYCWLGMGSLILPGVELGDFTIVGAGSVVTKSFKSGYCVIAGNPAKVIKELNPNDCIFSKTKYEYFGYIPSSKFIIYRKNHLKI
jgi:acetyltransferase-like isoleucine patch superfamily enzyme